MSYTVSAIEIPTFRPTVSELKNIIDYLVNVTKPLGKMDGLIKIEVPIEMRQSLIQNRVQPRDDSGSVVLAHHYVNYLHVQRQLDFPEKKSLSEGEGLLWAKMADGRSKPAVCNAGLNQSLFRQEDTAFNLNGLKSMVNHGIIV